MAITSEIIGKLGGADVQSFPVEGSATGSGAVTVLHIVEVPAGETWLVAVAGELQGPANSNQSSSQPHIRLGETTCSGVPRTTPFGISAVITETTAIELVSNHPTDSSFTGHVYTVKL